MIILLQWTWKNQDDVEDLRQASHHAQVFRLLDLSKLHNGKDVPDPYYTGNFDEVFQLVKDGCYELLQKIKAEL